MSTAPRRPGGTVKNMQKLTQSTISVSGGNGAAKAASYTFDATRVFCAIIVQGNRWSDTGLASITANSGITDAALIRLSATHSQSAGGTAVVMTGKAKKGAVITFRGSLRADGTQTATFTYAVFSTQ